MSDLQDDSELYQAVPDLTDRFEDSNVEFVDSDIDDDNPVENHTVTKADLDKALAARSGSSEIAEGFKGLSTALQQQSNLTAQALQALNRPATKEEVTEEQLYKQFADDVLDPEKAPAALKRIIDHVRNEERTAIGGVNAATMDRLSDLTFAQIAMADDAVAKAARPYHAEVKEMLGKLNPADRAKPENIRLTMNLVVANHLEDVIKATAGKEAVKTATAVNGETRARTAPLNHRPTNGNGGSAAPAIRVNINDPALRRMAEANWATTDEEIKAFAISQLRRNGGKPTWLSKK